MVAPVKTALKTKKDIGKNLEIKSVVKEPPTTDVNSTVTLENVTDNLNNETDIEQIGDKNKNEETTVSSTWFCHQGRGQSMPS